MRVAHKDASANPLEAARRNQIGQRECCYQSKNPQIYDTSKCITDQNVENGESSFGKNGP